MNERSSRRRPACCGSWKISPCPLTKSGCYMMDT